MSYLIIFKPVYYARARAYACPCIRVSL